MPRARKKPVEIEYKYLDPLDFDGAWEITKWCKGEFVGVGCDRLVYPNSTKIEIKTLEGTMCAVPGDYIIKGVNGEFYPCKSDIFLKTYDLIED